MSTARVIPSRILPELSRAWPAPTAPGWVLRLVQGGATSSTVPSPGISLRTTDAGGAALVEARLDDAVGLAAQALEAATRRAYTAIAAALAPLAARYPVRYWNFIPDFHAPLGRGTDRYMVFNAGRYAALLGEAGEQGGALLPTATGVGHHENELRILCLALGHRGRAVENPRQVPAYRYSARYGPRPPCFSRATEVELPGIAGRALLVGGTASVVGEDSRHSGDLPAQLRETCDNLGALVHAWRPTLRWPGSVLDARVYTPGRPDQAAALLGAQLGGRVEFVRADLCRSELLVEVEAVVADVPGDA
jgi:Chorismatase FkbO/Hyg5-like, N-terminal